MANDTSSYVIIGGSFVNLFSPQRNTLGFRDVCFEPCLLEQSSVVVSTYHRCEFQVIWILILQTNNNMGLSNEPEAQAS